MQEAFEDRNASVITNCFRNTSSPLGMFALQLYYTVMSIQAVLRSEKDGISVGQYKTVRDEELQVMEGQI